MTLEKCGALGFLILALSCGDGAVDKETDASGVNGTTMASNARTETGDEDAVVFAAAERFQVADCEFINACVGEIDVEACVDMEYDVSGECWVVDDAELEICEREVEEALQLTQCNGVEYPASCYNAIRPCQCLPGYVRGDIGNDCHPECGEGDSCPDDLECRAGACMEPMSKPCEEDQKQAEVNGEVGCFDQCPDGECDSGFRCVAGLCISD